MMAVHFGGRGPGHLARNQGGGAPPNLVGVGDSIIRGDGVSEFLPLVASRDGMNAVNLGVNGQSWDYAWAGNPGSVPMIDEVSSVAVYNGSGAKLIAMAGTNGLALKGNSFALEYADFEAWLAATLAAGWLANDITVCPILPRNPSFPEAARMQFNNALVIGAITHGYRVARFDLEEWALVAANLNATWYPDNTHPSSAIHALMDPIVYAAMTGTVDTVYSGELVIDGGFLNSASWNIGGGQGWSITGGQLVSTGTQYGAAFYPINIIEAGATYKVEFDVVTTADSGQLTFGSNSAQINLNSTGHISTTITPSSAGSVTANAGTAGGWEGTIDNLSIKKVL